MDKLANAKEYVNEYWPAREDARLPPKIVKDSVNKYNNPPANPIQDKVPILKFINFSIEITRRTKAIKTITLNEILNGRIRFKIATIDGGNGK